MEWLTSPETWISLVTLTLLEIVLGIDNIVFISILAGKLPEAQRDRARQLGLSLALITRVLLLCSLWMLSRLTQPLFGFKLIGYEVSFSGRDLILLAGGLFLIAKAVHEIHDKLEREDGEVTKRLAPTFASVLVQIVLLDIVFSLDSVITAVGMARQIGVMVAAVVVAMGFMLAFGGYISRFMDRHPTLKMLALSFLLLVGFVLVAEGFHREIPKGYIYFAMAFALGVEMLNLKIRPKQKPEAVSLHQPYR
jgi:predicted tellurium resistance membrane protein TerC